MTDPSQHSEHGSPYRGRDRRRASWHTFREAYPTFLKIAAAIFLALVVVDMWLVYRRVAYEREITRLRSSMTTAERQKSDLIVQSEKDKLRMALELAKRQARWDPELHLSVSVDSGRMYLERNGALLREMRVDIAPSRIPEVGGDTMVATTLLRGERTVEDVSDGSAPVLLLNGGTRIYAANDSTSVPAGDVRVKPEDLKAILPNVSAGMVVYFY
jgi:hypothetical protein